MTQAPWRSLLAGALHKNRSLPSSRYLQLATIRPDGTPANRTIVFRGFVPQEDYLQFVTDRRSEKIHDLKHQSIGELCWYFPKSREQFRIQGQVVLIDSSCHDSHLLKLRSNLWHNLSDQGRIQFAWPEPKGLRDLTVNDQFAPASPDRDQVSDHFCGLILEPEQVDHLQLKGNPQDRCLYQLHDGTWTTQQVNP
jgi:PPOX class probable FMN-dependent enzyme